MTSEYTNNQETKTTQLYGIIVNKYGTDWGVWNFVSSAIYTDLNNAQKDSVYFKRLYHADRWPKAMVKVVSLNII